MRRVAVIGVGVTKFGRHERSSAELFAEAAGDALADAGLPPSAWGMVDPRHLGKATTGMFDGHVESQTLEQLRDMRKWSNYATTPDWNFRPGP